MLEAYDNNVMRIGVISRGPICRSRINKTAL